MKIYTIKDILWNVDIFTIIVKNDDKDFKKIIMTSCESWKESNNLKEKYNLDFSDYIINILNDSKYNYEIVKINEILI